jgi:hypothetical protein
MFAGQITELFKVSIFLAIMHGFAISSSCQLNMDLLFTK